MAPQERYHVFSLPPALLETLIPRNFVNQPFSDHPSRPASPAAAPSNPSAAASRACNVCLGAGFTDVDEQRAHFRSDWHRYNVKMRVGGSNAVTEAQFSQLVDGLEDSISGSASSSSDSEGSDSDAVDTLVHKARKLNVIREEDGDDESRHAIPNAPVVWFHSPPSTQLGVYKAIFSNELASASSASPGSGFLDELRTLQSGGGDKGRKWALFMTAGGHFAGAIVRVSRPEGEEGGDEGLTKRGKPKKPKPDTEVLLHKTFHRYTTRRKQGGSQSLNDNSKSKAVSAGAMLRRYGEQALRDDIRNLLTDWADELEDCERIFIRASVSNRKIFLGYDGAVLQKDDERLRTFPFPTRRPTQSELTRCLLELIHVKISHLTEDALRAQDEEYLASRPKPPPPAVIVVPQKKADTKPKLSPEELARLQAEQDLRERWERALEMVVKGRVDALKSFLVKDDPLGGGVDAKMPDGLSDASQGETLLVFAVRKGQEEVVHYLLEDAHADPTIDVRAATAATVQEPLAGEVEDDDEASRPVSGGSRRTAYDFARTRNVRNVFRRCAAEHPDWWEWLDVERGARVPSILSKEMEEGRDEKKKARRKGLKDKVREREALQKEQQKETESLKPAEPPKLNVPTLQRLVKEDGPRRLGGSSTSEESVMGVTPEMRARIERERRARAAEARMKK